MLDLNRQNKLFKKYRGGSPSALMDLLETEKPCMYDYLLRMCGQVSRSTDTIEEVIQSLSTDELEDVVTLSEFRILIFKTARNFLKDIWDANTSVLENEAYDELRKNTDLTTNEREAIEHLEIVDNVLRGLSSERKECLLLKTKNGFEFDEIAEITNQSIENVEKLFDSGQKQLTHASSQLVNNISSLLPQIPHHPMPVLSMQETMNLSILMKDIKTRPSVLKSQLKIALLLVVIAILVTYYLKPEAFVLPDFVWNFIRTYADFLF